MAEEKNKERQQKAVQFQFLQQHLQEISQQLELLQDQQAELALSMDALQRIREAEKETEFLAPVANGIFVKGSLQDTKTLIVNVGSDVTVEMGISEAVDLLKQQQREVMEKAAEADALLQGLGAEALKIYKELENADKE